MAQTCVVLPFSYIRIVVFTLPVNCCVIVKNTKVLGSNSRGGSGWKKVAIKGETCKNWN